MEAGDKKKAIILETNFIYQNAKTLEKVVGELSKHGTIYVTQVTVDERIAKAIRELRTKYKELEQKKKTEYCIFASIRFTKTLEDAEEYYRKGIQSNYEKVFPEKIIPFSADETMFKAVLQRANDKKAPFGDAENASDKGFKDSLIWLSILDYFKENGENEAVLITDDKAFSKNPTDLEKEFHEFTGKRIEIKPNSYYKELNIEEKPAQPQREEPLPNFSALRFELESDFDSITLTQEEDYFGNHSVESAFHVYNYVGEKYAEAFFSELKSNIEAHVFERMVAPSAFFGINNTEVDDIANIPIENLEKCLHLFERIKVDYSQYILPFYRAFAQAVNYNRRSKPTAINRDDIPF